MNEPIFLRHPTGHYRLVQAGPFRWEISGPAPDHGSLEQGVKTPVSRMVLEEAEGILDAELLQTARKAIVWTTQESEMALVRQTERLQVIESLQALRKERGDSGAFTDFYQGWNQAVARAVKTVQDRF